MSWVKRLWSCIWGNIIIRRWRPHPERDKLIYGRPRDSLRDRFNRIRTTAYTLKDSGSSDDYNLRFSLLNMTESVWIPVRDNEGSGSVA